jgi:DNA-binding MarR family transcriptional regulator
MTAYPDTSSSAAPTDLRVSVGDRELPPLARDYTAWLITSLAARLSRGASGYYTREWKIGSTEYRLLMALGREETCSAISAATAADIDKAAASRSLKILEAEGLVESVRHGREMRIQLTPEGRKLRGKLKTATDRRDRRLTHGMSAAEVARLRADLHRLLDNLPYMNAG